MARRVLAVTACMVLLSLAGCVEPGPSRGGWAIHGHFTEATTQADVEDLQRRLAAFGTSADILESYPMQYRIAVDDGPTCDRIRAMLEQRPYIDTVGRCQATQG